MSFSLVELVEISLESEVEGLFKQILRLPLLLCDAEVGHVCEVGLGGVEDDEIPLMFLHPRGVVTVDQLQVCHHPGLPVGGEVGGAVDELGQGDPGPVLPRVAERQEVSPGAAAAGEEGGAPGGSPGHVAPLAEVAADWVPEEGDVEIPPVPPLPLSGGHVLVHTPSQLRPVGVEAALPAGAVAGEQPVAALSPGPQAGTVELPPRLPPLASPVTLAGPL